MEISRTVHLSRETMDKIKNRESGYTPDRAKAFEAFYERIERELFNHRVITSNPFTAWWETGEINVAQVRHFITQFSVFSNLFIIAQLQKVMNADSLEAMRASKEILVNELGVIFRPQQKTDLRAKTDGLSWDYVSDPDLVSPEGTVEGGTFRFSAAHFEWLLRMAEVLGLSFQDIGKRRHGTKSTVFFCDELYRLYGSDDYEVAQAASFAVENWAKAGFWKQLIRGFEKFKARQCPSLPLGFFTYHDRLEDQHAAHTKEELEEYYFKAPTMDESAFIRNGNEMLDGVAAFWDGLDRDRLTSPQ